MWQFRTRSIVIYIICYAGGAAAPPAPPLPRAMSSSSGSSSFVLYFCFLLYLLSFSLSLFLFSSSIFSFLFLSLTLSFLSPLSFFKNRQSKQINKAAHQQFPTKCNHPEILCWRIFFSFCVVKNTPNHSMHSSLTNGRGLNYPCTIWLSQIDWSSFCPWL